MAKNVKLTLFSKFVKLISNGIFITDLLPIEGLYSLHYDTKRDFAEVVNYVLGLLYLHISEGFKKRMINHMG